MRLALIFLFCVSTLGWTWGDSLVSKNKEAGRLYKEGKIDEALSKWREAQTENPENGKLRYNIGNGLYELEKYEDAFNQYQRTLDSKDSELRQKAYYNMGNTHYRMGKLPEAIEDYKKSLEINPDDEDAKYNIEFIKKKLEEQKEQESKQEQGKGEEEKQEQKSAEQQEAQGQKAEQEKPEEGNGMQENKQKSAGEEKPETEGAEKKPSTAEREEQMSREDAVRLLDAVKDDEKDLQEELRKRPAEGRYRVDKDW
ncbi:MAG: tetratricopeptide repeat protein [Candidatus Omnitrophota bacterium]|jgi:tetratricopeptide (TPR) repeat protein